MEPFKQIMAIVALLAFIIEVIAFIITRDSFYGIWAILMVLTINNILDRDANI